MRKKEIDDEAILQAIYVEERKMVSEGVPLPLRVISLSQKVMAHFPDHNKILFPNATTEIGVRIQSAMKSFFHSADQRIAVHVGTVIFEEFICLQTVPRVYGAARVNPLDYLDLPDMQKKLLQDDEEKYLFVLDQCADVFDFDEQFYPLKNNLLNEEIVYSYTRKARENLQTASLALSARKGFSGAVQAALLASELVMKAGMGADPISFKIKYGHKLGRITSDLSVAFPLLDASRIENITKNWPEYTESRYNKEFNRSETSSIVVQSQFVVSEVFRQISRGNFRATASDTWKRRFP